MKTRQAIEDQSHGANCASRMHTAAECTCGKADALAAAEEDPICSCQGCDWEGPESKLKEIADFHQRVDPGEECPAGECPECGCLAHVMEPDVAAMYHIGEDAKRTRKERDALRNTLEAIAHDCEDFIGGESDVDSGDLAQAILRAANEVLRPGVLAALGQKGAAS